MKILLDTNVLIDYYLHRENFYGDASKIVMGAICKDFGVWASAKSYTDIFYVGKKLTADGAFAEWAQFREQLQNMFFESFKYINVASIDIADIRTACTYNWEDFEDCLISVAAEKINANYIVTRDATGFARSKTKAIHPTDFLEIVERELGIKYEEARF